MTKPGLVAQDDEAIRERLNIILRRHTKADIARKTGTSAVNVSRYSRGTQIPAAFCAALGRSLGVNSNF